MKKRPSGNLAIYSGVRATEPYAEHGAAIFGAATYGAATHGAATHGAATHGAAVED